MTLTFWKAALVRALKTFCQTAAALIPAGMAITSVDWIVILQTAALAGVLSILTSLGGGLPEISETGAEE